MKRFIAAFIILLCVWILFTASFNREDLIVGVGASIAVTLLAARFMFPRREDVRFFQTITAFLFFLVNFMVEEVKAHVKMAITILKGDEGGACYVTLKRPFRSEMANLLVYNGITLTPGTIVVKCENRHAVVHSAWEAKEGKVGERFINSVKRRGIK